MVCPIVTASLFYIFFVLLLYCSLAVTSLTCKAVVTCDLCHSPVICHLTTCHFHIWRLCTTPSSYPNHLDVVNLGQIFATLHSQVHDTASSSGSHMITPDYLYLVPQIYSTKLSPDNF